MNVETIMPPTAPAKPPMPTTEAIARRGNMSEVSVNTLADQPWCPAVASPISATASHRLSARAAKTIGTTASAQTSIAPLRARLTLQPRLMSRPASQPPVMLPTSAATKIAINGSPSSSRLRPYSACRNFGSQNRKNHHTGSVMNLAATNAQAWRWRRIRAHGTRTVGSGGSLRICASSVADSAGCCSGVR